MAPVIELVGVSRYYRMGDEQIAALDGVGFAVEAGELVAIVGSSGSGKSTLLNILGCLDTPSSGTYRLDGRDVQDLSDHERAHARNRKIGFVFQSFQLLHRATAQKNVALPLVYRGIPARERNARAAEALAKVGLERPAPAGTWSRGTPKAIASGVPRRRRRASATERGDERRVDEV
ncbi:MAG TPA: ATP-binding cassette domain-containing protein, partial [Kofleriaceae bacterium]|nr:ATP-binding cassette domain-containing protein [Kofleriaceae bacterium]